MNDSMNFTWNMVHIGWVSGEGCVIFPTVSHIVSLWWRELIIGGSLNSVWRVMVSGRHVHSVFKTNGVGTSNFWSFEGWIASIRKKNTCIGLFHKQLLEPRRSQPVRRIGWGENCGSQQNDFVLGTFLPLNDYNKTYILWGFQSKINCLT